MADTPRRLLEKAVRTESVCTGELVIAREVNEQSAALLDQLNGFFGFGFPVTVRQVLLGPGRGPTSPGTEVFRISRSVVGNVIHDGGNGSAQVPGSSSGHHLREYLW